MVEVNRRDMKTPTELADARIEKAHKTEDKQGIFCPGPNCPHYSQATKYPRKCFYEPQCWRGWLDILLKIFVLRLRRLEMGKHH